MNIGIIGSGHIGGALGKRWSQAGHAVLFSSRHPAELLPLLRGLPPTARAGTVAEAAAFGEVVLLATSYAGIGEVLTQAGSLKGTVVIDATNPYQPGGGGLAVPDTTGAQEISLKIPEARLVKAFNTLPAQYLSEAPRPAAEQRAVFYCGDDEAAKRTVAGLIADIGFVPVDAGPLSRVAAQEPRGPLYAKVLTEAEARALLTTL